MTGIIQSSLVFRGLKAFVLALYNAWPYSVLGRLSAFLKENYEVSCTKKIWIRFCNVENRAAYSRYGKALGKLRKLLLSLGRILQQSLFYRLLVFVRDVYFRVTKGSLLFEQIHRLSLRQWLLVAFAFYLPLEYIIRDKVSIGFVASVWEELFIIAAAFLILGGWRWGRAKPWVGRLP